MRKSELIERLRELERTVDRLDSALIHHKYDLSSLTSRVQRQEAAANPPTPPDHEKALIQANQAGYQQAVKDMNGSK